MGNAEYLGLGSKLSLRDVYRDVRVGRWLCMSYHNGALKPSKVYERALERHVGAGAEREAGVECEGAGVRELAALARLVEGVIVNDPIWLTFMTEGLWSEKCGLKRDQRRRSELIRGSGYGAAGGWGVGGGVWKSEIGEMEGWSSGVSGLGDGVAGYEILMYLRVGTLFRYRCGG